MFVPINLLLKMIGMHSVNDPTLFKQLGFRVFSADKGRYYLLRNSAILFIRSDSEYLENLHAYDPVDDYEGYIKKALLSPIEYREQLIVTEVNYGS